jgi:aryl-phospho-beta-D-glucosidase BglC (GH1 family)
MNVGNELELNWGPPNMALFYSAVQNGFNAVRIPCAWDMSGAATNISGGVTNYVISSAYMAQVKQTVDAAIAAGMYVMINDHWDDGWLQSNIGTTVDPVINAKVNAYWTQIATTFAGYDNHLLFAASNEPDVTSPAAMDTLMYYYQTFVNAVRSVGGYNTGAARRRRHVVVEFAADGHGYQPPDGGISLLQPVSVHAIAGRRIVGRDAILLGPRLPLFRRSVS